MGKSGLIDASEIRLDTVAGNQSKQLDAYTLRVEQSISELSQNAAIAQALETMTTVVPTEKDAIIEAFRRDGCFGGRTRLLQWRGTATALCHSPRDHQRRHCQRLAQHPRQRHLRDRKNGLIIYSVTKGKNFLTNVAEPQNAALKDLFQRIEAGKDGVISTTGFSGGENDSAMVGCRSPSLTGSVAAQGRRRHAHLGGSYRRRRHARGNRKIHR